MKTRQQGFTLIELVMVIVILGILAVVAIPKFIDLRADARLGATQGVAGALGSASAINYAVCQISPSTTLGSKCVAITACTDIGALLQSTTTFTVAGTIPACTAGHPDAPTTVTASFVGHTTL